MKERADKRLFGTTYAAQMKMPSTEAPENVLSQVRMDVGRRVAEGMCNVCANCPRMLASEDLHQDPLTFSKVVRVTATCRLLTGTAICPDGYDPLSQKWQHENLGSFSMSDGEWSAPTVEYTDKVPAHTWGHLTAPQIREYQHKAKMHPLVRSTVAHMPSAEEASGFMEEFAKKMFHEELGKLSKLSEENLEELVASLRDQPNDQPAASTEGFGSW